MHVYWDEFTITWDGGRATGNGARDKVRDELGVVVEGNASTTPARVTWRGRLVSSELVAVAIRALIDARPWRLIYKPSRRIARAPEGFNKLDLVSAAQRERLNNASTKPPIYAIIGCGAAATVNHTTLRQTTWGRERVGNAEIVHIGFENPWRHYNRHEMGQFPQLLGLPGYERRPNLGEENPSEPRDSTLFAAETTHELGRIRARLAPAGQPLRVFHACVALIQARGQKVNDSVKGNLVQEGLNIDDLEDMLGMLHAWKRGRYRMLLVQPNGDLDWAYADKIDICTGAGKARTIDESMATPEVRDETYTKIWEPPESWDDARCKRPIMSGTEALYRQTQWPANKRVCIMGSGGVGVNMIERARDTTCFADWLATQTLHASFVIGRNDILLKHPLLGPKAGAAMEMDDFVGRNDQLAPIDPKDDKWRFGQGADIGSVELLGGVDTRQVRVKFVSSRRRYQNTPNNADMNGQPIPSMVRDAQEKETALDDEAFAFTDLTEQQLGEDYEPNVYDRVIRAAGQDIRDVGQSEQLAMQLELQPIVNADDRMVGLQSADGTIRVLGAAATGNAQLVERTNPAAVAMRQYHGSLPAQGQIIFVGFVFSALNVAAANHYFDETPNCNVNTASQQELETLWGDATLAERTVNLRRSTQCGFTWDSRKALLLSHRSWLAAMRPLFPEFATIVTTDSLTLFEPRDNPPLGFVEWKTMLGHLGLLPLFVNKVIRAHLRRPLATMVQLKEELETNEEADRIEHAAIKEAGLLAYGWESSLSTPRTIEEFNNLARDVIATRTSARFADWVVEARTANGQAWPSMDALRADIERRFRLKLDRRNSLEPLPSGWKDQLDTAAAKLGNAKTKYRPADPLLFPPEV